MVDLLELRNNFYSTSLPIPLPLASDVEKFYRRRGGEVRRGEGGYQINFLLFRNFMCSASIKPTTSLISTLNAGETNKIATLKHYFILRVRVFSHNFTNIEKGVKCRRKNSLTQRVRKYDFQTSIRL